MNPILTACLLAVAGVFFLLTLVRRLRVLRACRAERRTDHLLHRTGLWLRYGIGQRRLVAEGARWFGTLHVIVFAAFLVLAIRTITLFGMGFSEGFHLPLLAPDSLGGRCVSGAG